MRILKILNNNVITTKDFDSGQEKVIMGRGIAFQKKKGDLINESKIEKVFSLQNENENLKFQNLINKIPFEHIQVSEQIISRGREILKTEFDDHIYIALTDHLSFAIKRAEMGLNISNNLIWEIRRLYKKEYQIGLWALKLIKEELNIELDEDEAGFIALHMINASTGEQMSNTMEMTTMVKDILDIIENHFEIKIVEDSIFYDRLITHLKFFAQRAISKKQIEDEDESLLQMIKESYKSAYECAVEIKKYVEKNYEHQLCDQELSYISLHIRRIEISIKNK